MDIKCYLAMTAAEAAAVTTFPPYMAWMACHFSCYGTGLSNLPQSLPEGSMVIVNDRTPPYRHDPALITQQLLRLAQELNVSSFLLDLQRPDLEENRLIAQTLTKNLPYPVAVTALYAEDLDCPVFLSAPPPHHALKEHISPWKDREIWLEAAIESEQVTVTEQGSTAAGLSNGFPEEAVFHDDALHCHYSVALMEKQAVFSICRNRENIQTYLAEAETLGIKKAIGLYQQLQDRNT